MKVLVIGGGGREHTLAWQIRKSALVDDIFCAPGNGGTEEIAENIYIKAENIGELLKFAKEEEIDLTIVGPEAPLVKGIVNAFQNEGLKIFGPNRDAAIIEGSKAFSRKLMKKMGVSQPSYKIFNDVQRATDYLKEKSYPIVIKASGLAAGKGAIIVTNPEEAKDTIDDMMVKKRFGKAGEKVVIEEFLQGEEVSLLVLTDGKDVLPFISSQDHKPIYEGDKGPNTGGMGAYAPAPILYQEETGKVIDTVILPVLSGLKEEGINYRGVLYAGLIITEQGPKVLEFNCRFGDPETQAILPLLDSDLAESLIATIEGDIKNVNFRWTNGSAVCVVLASGGYPVKYEKGKQISGLENLKPREDVVVFHAGTRREKGKLITSGGRVLGIAGIGNNLKQAIETAYSAVEKISFDNMYYRKDIGKKGLQYE
jgi:phosphoribosylamine--glycine ligase